MLIFAKSLIFQANPRLDVRLDFTSDSLKLLNPPMGNFDDSKLSFLDGSLTSLDSAKESFDQSKLNFLERSFISINSTEENSYQTNSWSVSSSSKLPIVKSGDAFMTYNSPDLQECSTFVSVDLNSFGIMWQKAPEKKSPKLNYRRVRLREDKKNLKTIQGLFNLTEKEMLEIEMDKEMVKNELKFDGKPYVKAVVKKKAVKFSDIKEARDDIFDVTNDLGHSNSLGKDVKKDTAKSTYVKLKLKVDENQNVIRNDEFKRKSLENVTNSADLSVDNYSLANLSGEGEKLVLHLSNEIDDLELECDEIRHLERTLNDDEEYVIKKGITTAMIHTTNDSTDATFLEQDGVTEAAENDGKVQKDEGKRSEGDNDKSKKTSKKRLDKFLKFFRNIFKKNIKKGDNA